MVDGVDVGHTVGDNAADFLESLVGTHRADRIALYEYVALREEFQGFKSGAIRPQDSLPTFDEAVLVADQISDFDNVRSGGVVQYFDGLWGGNATRKELDEIAGVEYSGRIVGFACSFDGHAAFNQVKGAGYAVRC